MTLRRVVGRAARAAAWTALASALGLAAAWLAFPFPRRLLLEPPAGPAVLDREGRPLAVLVGSDGQWRRPVPLAEMGRWLPLATVAVEDRRFYSHPGVDPVAAARAALRNLLSGRVRSGASTITMQLCRMLDPRPRNLSAKAVESLRALQIERILTKDGILERYLNLAPYGGNVRGARAASRIWFGKEPADLSLAEAALLAGLPQSPARYRPDLYPEAASARRREVLARMEAEGAIGGEESARAGAEPVRVRPLAGAGGRLSSGAGWHAAFLALSRRPAGGRTAIDLPLQRIVSEEAALHAATLPAGSEVAVVVIDVGSAEIRALTGSADFFDPAGGQVNGALALRSPGSALKPFLYAAAFATGRLAPDSAIPDRPVSLAGWSPRNFDEEFAGTITAADALRTSRNVPAILVARATGLARVAGAIRAAGVPLRDDAVERGGLSLATGGIEVRLLDLANAYATLARGGVFRPAKLFPDDPSDASPALDPRAVAAVNEILGAGPEDGPGWYVAKTGTSSGRRDALAAGHNGRFAIGVWAGDFSGAGRFEYTGLSAAEPLLARLFAHPRIRTDLRPAPAPPLRAEHPFFAPGEAPPPAIRVPEAGAVLLAREGTALVPAEATRPEGTWFLDGRRVAAGATADLAVPAGVHELRFVTPDGRAAAVPFTVR